MLGKLCRLEKHCGRARRVTPRVLRLIKSCNASEARAEGYLVNSSSMRLPQGER